MENFIRIVLEQLDRIENSLDKDKSILNIDEVSQLTGISKSTLYKLTSAREIPHYKKAKNLIFDRDEIISWLKSNEITCQEKIDQEANNYVVLNDKKKR